MATVLSPAELASLKRLAESPGASVPREHRALLIRLGLIVEVLGATRLTSVGIERSREDKVSPSNSRCAYH